MSTTMTKDGERKDNANCPLCLKAIEGEGVTVELPHCGKDAKTRLCGPCIIAVKNALER